MDRKSSLFTYEILFLWFIKCLPVIKYHKAISMAWVTSASIWMTFNGNYYKRKLKFGHRKLLLLRSMMNMVVTMMMKTKTFYGSPRKKLRVLLIDRVRESDKLDNFKFKDNLSESNMIMFLLPTDKRHCAEHQIFRTLKKLSYQSWWSYPFGKSLFPF